MKKLLSLVTVAIACLQALAIPAHPGTTAMPQPDGTMITIELHGDEYYCFTTTADGYTLLQNEQGAYEYARRSGDILVSTGVMAHDAALRTASENALLQGISRRVTDSAAITQSKAMRARRDAAAKVQRYDYSKFRGLIILINYTDVQFSMSDPNSFYDHMINDEGFTGYNDDNGQWVSCTGSVRDYFDNQSSGRFKPHFDVVGPITVNYKSTDHRRTTNSATIFRAALSAANSQVDYSLYDTDNNGVVDMVFFLCAGMSSSFSGNNSQLLWPHRSRISAYYDGKSFGDYACSNELYGWESTPSSIATEGIGTFCHEFSHVLGFPDLYDVDYDGTGGESHHPGSWDIMAGGGSYNYSRTPCGYTIFERFSLGWANPSVITQNGSYTLGAVNQTNEGYIIKSPSATEYFLLENRQKTGWDYYLPGHGMTICRVDSTNLRVWLNNGVNNDPTHMYYEMLRAGNATSGDNPSDPFPGTAKVRLIDSQSTPNLNTWSQLPNEFMIHSIAENGGVITFGVMKESEVETLVEDFETMPVTTSTRETNVPGRFATWTFSKSNVMSPTEEDSKNGQNAVGIVSGGVLTMTSDFNYEPYLVTVRAFNPTTTEAKYKLLYSTNQGSTWTALDDVISVQANTLSRLAWSVNIDKPVRFRISMTGGSTSKKSYLDDVTIYHRDAFQSYKQGDVNGDGEVDVNDVNILINIVLGKDDASQYGGRANVDGAGDVDVADVNTLINLVLGK